MYRACPLGVSNYWHSKNLERSALLSESIDKGLLMPIRWKSSCLVIVITLPTLSFPFWLAMCGSAPPTAAEVEAELSRTLEPGDSLETACAVLSRMHAVTNCELFDGYLLLASIESDQVGWRLVRRSVSVKIVFDAAGEVLRVECRDVYTGP